MNLLQKLVGTAVAAALVFAITLNKENKGKAGYDQVRQELRLKGKPIEIVRGFIDHAQQAGKPDEAVNEYVAPNVVSHLPTGKGREGVLAWLNALGKQKAIATGAQEDTVMAVYPAENGAVQTIVYRIKNRQIAEIWSATSSAQAQ